MTEPNQRLRRHKLLTAEIRKALPAIGTTDGQGMDAIAHLKLFCPYGRMTLYVTEFDGDDQFYGYMVSPLGPDCDEWGYSSYQELAEMNRGGGAGWEPADGTNGLPLIERDCFWTPTSIKEAIQ